ncbi:MAG: PilZ domain-containing protein [Magnetococcus sp. DMHC-6]
MVAQIPATLDNPFFLRYGRITDRCFPPNMSVGAPILIFPEVIKGIEANFQGSEQNDKLLADYADTVQLEYLQKQVDKYRQLLLDEQNSAQEVSGSAHPYQSLPPITKKLQEFRTALQSKSEAMLSDNPFYELTGLIYRLNVETLKNAFIDWQQNASDNPPPSISVSRSLIQIWTSSGQITSLQQKLIETFGKIISIGKITLGLFLFCGSAMTTSKGVNDLVQSKPFVESLGDYFVGAEPEHLRLLLSLFIGLLLSSIILDFKDRLFKGIAQAGQVWTGIKQAFKISPRWLTTCLFLTMISIWTNYDGIVLLISQKADLDLQLAKIQKQVLNGLGDPTNRHPEDPKSLHDLGALLEQKAKQAILQFKDLPMDEMSGVASSGLAVKGPRYYGKFFIVNGDFELGRNDVATLSPKSSLSAQIDRMILKSRLDFKPSMETKINQIVTLFTEDLTRTQAEVEQKLNALTAQMSLHAYSLDELLRIFSLESYTINHGVVEIVKLLEHNKEMFVQTVAHLNQTANETINLLREVDKIGTDTANTYNIEVNIDIPSLEAIDQLKNNQITMAERRNLNELKKFLLQQYGSTLSSFMLFLILFVAIAMDLSDPIFYSAMIARWGRKDRHFLNENLSRFQNWELQHIKKTRIFLTRPDIRPLLPLPCPSLPILYDIYHRFLEEIHPVVKDNSTRTFFEIWRFWFMGLFLTTRIHHVQGYNARQSVTQRIVLDQINYTPRFLNRIYPGILTPFRIGVDHFDSLYENIFKQFQNNDTIFREGLESVIPDIALKPEDISTTENSKSTSIILPTTSKKSQKMDKSLLWQNVFNKLYLITLKAWPETEAPFPLTRLNWLSQQLVAKAESRARINHFSNLAPYIKKTLFGEYLIPMEQEILAPLNGLLTKIPNYPILEKTLRIGHYKEEYRKIKNLLTDVVGFSLFTGFQVPTEILHTIIRSYQLPLFDTFLSGFQQDTSAIEKQILTLSNHLKKAYQTLEILDQEQNGIIMTLTKMRKDYLSPIQAIMERLAHGNSIEKAFSLDRMKKEIFSIEKAMLSLWKPAPVPGDGVWEPGHESDALNFDHIFNLSDPNSTARFSLLDHLRKMESKLAEIYKQLNSSIFVITFVDKLTHKIQKQLLDSMDLVQLITHMDGQMSRMTYNSQEIGAGVFNFLENNRLFFRSVPAQIQSIQERLFMLIEDPKLAESHSVELFRALESQSFKLNHFLKNALEFIEGKRDGMGLSASMAQLMPTSEKDATALSPPPSARTLPSSKSDAVAATNFSALNPVQEKLCQEVEQSCEKIRQTLRQIGKKEWELLQQPIPPQEHLNILKMRKPFIDQSFMDAEKFSNTLMELVNDVDALQNNPAKAESLKTLHTHSMQHWQELEAILNKISTPSIVDRRQTIANSLAAAQKESQPYTRRVVDAVMPKIAEVKNLPNFSRRVLERTRFEGQVELTIEGGMSFLGKTRDISPTGLAIEIATPAQNELVGKKGHFILLNDPRRTSIPCHILRVSGIVIILTLTADQESIFIKLMRDEIIRRGEEFPDPFQIRMPTLPEMPMS